MFRLALHALWSHDYVDPLMRMLAKVCDCDLEDARRMVDSLASQTTLILEAHTPTEASFLARDLLQFGVFVEVEQVGRITDESLILDAVTAMPKTMHGWYVLMDEQSGRPMHLLDRHTLVSMRYEAQKVTEEVGEEMLRRGAIPIDRERMAELETVMDGLRPKFEHRENEFMAGRIRLIKERRRWGQASWLDSEDDEADYED